MNKFNWPDLIKDISEALVLTQQDFASRVGSSQQSVSHWFNCVRPPSAEKQKKIIRMAKKANLDIDKYNLDGEKFKDMQYELEYRELPLRLRKVALRIQKLNKNDQRKILDNLELVAQAMELRK